MREPVARDCVRKRFLNVLLSDQLAECLRTVLPRQNLIHGMELKDDVLRKVRMPDPG